MHHGGEHVPLDFKPAVRTRIEDVTAERITRADEASDEDQPICNDAELAVEGVYGLAEP